MAAQSAAKVAQSKSVPSTQNPDPAKGTRPVENDHNVYILGAGFSSDAGLPMIGGFLTRMRDAHPWLEAKKDRHWEAFAIAQVLKFRLTAASAAYWVSLDLENIEELFSLADATASADDLDENIRTAIAATLDFAAKTKTVTPLSFNANYASELKAANVSWVQSTAASPGELIMARYPGYVAKLLGMFRDSTVKGKNTFITFNYDTVLEDALVDLQVPFHYGFRGQAKEPLLDRDLSQPDVAFDSSAKAQADIMSGIPVLKLHGSTNWSRPTKTDDDGRQEVGPLTVYGSYESIRFPLVPQLVPPTWRKTLQSGLHHVWSEAVKALQDATNIVIIGFSMPPTDTHFKYLMAAGLQQNISLRRILFVNPSVKDLEQRARKLLRKDYMKPLNDPIYLSPKPIQFLQNDLQSFVNSSWMEALGRPFPIGLDVKPSIFVA